MPHEEANALRSALNPCLFHAHKNARTIVAVISQDATVIKGLKQGGLRPPLEPPTISFSNRLTPPTGHIKSRHIFLVFDSESAGLKCPLV